VVFVEAVDGLLLRRRAMGITRGELACFYSHVGVWLHIVASGDPLTLVLEDDADVRLPEQWADIRDALASAPPDVDVLFLGHNNQHGRPGVRPAKGDVWGCHAMLISSKGAHKLCDAYARNEGIDSATGNHLPVDVWMSRQKGLRLFCVIPSMVHPVDIQDSETQRVR
jgi:GR25 family glycosyltransferase involved in LPS biosynthesis